MVILAAVDAATVDYRPRFSRNDGLALLTIAQNSGLAHGFALSNSGTITSNGGQIALQAAAANSGQSSSITNSGTITATTYAPGSLFNQTTMRGSIFDLDLGGGGLGAADQQLGDYRQRHGRGGNHLDWRRLRRSQSQPAQQPFGGDAGWGKDLGERRGQVRPWRGYLDLGHRLGGDRRDDSRARRAGDDRLGNRHHPVQEPQPERRRAGEVSSLGDYELTAVVDTSAREGYGTTGTLIIDPANLELVTSCTSLPGFTCLTTANALRTPITVPTVGNTFQLMVSKLLEKLTMSSLVIIAPDGSAAGNFGKITVMAAINYTGSNSLTLRAGSGGIAIAATGSITTNGSLTLETLTGGITLARDQQRRGSDPECPQGRGDGEQRDYHDESSGWR